MEVSQELIHKLEVGGGMRHMRIGLAVLAVLVLIVGYNWRDFRNLGTQEAMDSAQVGRNIAQGKGFSTLFIRPFSLFLVKRHYLETHGLPGLGQTADATQIKGSHPDLANPPVYPFVLAGLMKVLPFHYVIPKRSQGFWGNDGGFWRYQPDFLIAVFNQLLFFVIIGLVFRLALRLFDSTVAWLSAIVLLGTEMFWRFSVSGLSTMVLALIFIGLVWCLVLFEEEAREPGRGAGRLLIFALLLGVLAGVGAMTRYSFGWLILPVLAFLLLFGGERRVIVAVLALVAFAVIMAPWVVRNYKVSGTPFGTAGYAIYESSGLFSEFHLQRSLEPDLNQPALHVLSSKLMANLRPIFQNDLPRLGGSWLSGFFLVGLLVSFRSEAITRLRYFMLMCLFVLVVVQALGRTQLAEDSPDINSENLLVLLVPLILIYGVSLFLMLLEQLRLPLRELRYVVTGLFCIFACLPMIFAFLPPKSIPVAFPPYFPPAIQTFGGWLKETELSMSDVPWAMAWYGQRQCVWLTLRCTSDPKDPDTHEDFFAINDYLKPISELYLTPLGMDRRFLTQWVKSPDQSWGTLILNIQMARKVPDYFPLHESEKGWLPDQLVLTDWKRWTKSTAAE